MVIENDRTTTGAVRAEIARAGRTHKDIQAATGISSARWQRRLRQGTWQIGELRTIAKALGIPLSQLTGDN